MIKEHPVRIRISLLDDSAAALGRPQADPRTQCKSIQAERRSVASQNITTIPIENGALRTILNTVFHAHGRCLIVVLAFVVGVTTEWVMCDQSCSVVRGLD